MTVDTIGQDLAFNDIVFMQFEVKGGVQTLCAMAAAPDGVLQNSLNTLKMVLAHSKHKLRLGAQLGIMDLMTTSNDMFEEAMKNFPKVKKTVQAPNHIGLGNYINITSDVITSLKADQVGTEMNFLDINKAHRDGYFGMEPGIWGRQGVEFAHQLLEQRQ